MANPYLEVESGAEAKRYELEIGVDDVIVGRSTDCHWVISSGAVSRRHARIRRQSGDITIEDLGSSNGTFVNGVRLSEPHALHDDDTVKFGSVEARFFVPAKSAEADATVSISDLPPAMLGEAPKSEPSAHTGTATPAPAAPASKSASTGTGTTTSMPTRVEPAPSSETSVRPAPPPPPQPSAPSSPPATSPATAARAASAGPSFVELAVIAAGSFIVVFGLGAILVRFAF